MASTQLIIERSIYIGSYIGGILYGVQLVMFFMSTYFMFNKPGALDKDVKYYTLYGVVVLILLTIDIACNAVFGQLMWIEHRDVPGGPAAYMYQNISLWVNTLGTASGVTLNFLGDALLLYRCFIIWGSNLKVIAFPMLLFLGSTTMSILTVVESAKPAGFFKGQSVSFGVPYVSMTISLNIILTSLICGRLFVLRRQVRSVLTSEHAKMYTGVAAMLIESAAPFTIMGIIYGVTYARHTPTTFAFVQVWGKFSALSPQLIILRVALGQAWTKDTASKVTDLVFTHREHSENPGMTTDSSPSQPYSGRSGSQGDGNSTTAASVEKLGKSQKLLPF